MKTIIALGTAFALACGVAACTERQEQARTDSAITVDVEKELNDENVRGTIVVTSANGIVTLSGTVPDAAAKSKAEDIAEDVDGVDRVVNNLKTTMAGDAPARPAPPMMNPNAPAPPEPPAVNPDAAPLSR